MTKEQVKPIPARVHEVKEGPNDGQLAITIAWFPSAKELEDITRGCPIFVTMFGGLAPHCLTTSLEEATSVK